MFVGPTCPENFIPYPSEPDGRTCYANTTNKPPANVSHILENCMAADNYLQRPGVPSRPEILDLIKPAARYEYHILVLIKLLLKDPVICGLMVLIMEVIFGKHKDIENGTLTGILPTSRIYPWKGNGLLQMKIMKWNFSM